MKKVKKTTKYLVSRTVFSDYELKLISDKGIKLKKRNNRYYVTVKPKFTGNFNSVDVLVVGYPTMTKTLNTGYLKSY
jgi:hypothetical protein